MSLEKLIVITSDDKDPAISVNNSNFIVQLREQYYTQNISRLYVKEISVPNVFYNIRSSNGFVNNSIRIQETGQPPFTVPVPEGQYNITTYITALENAINGVLVGGNVVTIAQDPITQKLNFDFSLTATTVYAVDPLFPESQMADVIGISTDKTGISFDCDYPPDLSGYNMLYVHSDQISQSHGVDSVRGLTNLTDSISLHDVPYGSFAYKPPYNDELASIIYEQPRNLSQIRIVLRDKIGNALDIGNKKMVVILKVFFSF